jgi:hypothetical protein
MLLNPVYNPSLRSVVDVRQEQVDEVIMVVPEACRHCQQPFPASTGHRRGRVWQQQVVELLPLAVRVTEY